MTDAIARLKKLKTLRKDDVIELVEHNEKHTSRLLVREVKHYINDHGIFYSVYVIRI